MSDHTQPNSSDSPQWWLSKDGTPDGPHSEAYILAGLQTGTISPHTYACPVGQQEWKRLRDWPAFASSMPALPPPPLPSMNPVPILRPAWNPRSIAWLGLLFSPVWAGIMAAINARRLHVLFPIWQPIAIGVGATVLDIVVSTLLFDSCVLDVILYLGATGAIWFLYLAPQVRPFEARRTETGQQAGWVLPSLVGSPAAMLVIFGFAIVPLLPLQPREVCQRFADAISADSLEQAKKCTTMRLWPALAASHARKSDAKERIELADEAENPLGMSGYGVGYRHYTEEKGEAHVAEGFYLLVNEGHGWKINEWYVIAYDSQPASEPIAMSEYFHKMKESSSVPNVASEPASPPTAAKPPAKKSEAPNAAKEDNPFRYSRGISGAVGTFVYRCFGWTGVVVFLLLIFGGFIGSLFEKSGDNKKS